jgi:peptidyl-prolyl cis-trans isomerase D
MVRRAGAIQAVGLREPQDWLMISTFRAYLGTWVVRAFFIVLVASFALWGIGDVLKLVGSATWIAKVGDHAIEPPELDQAYRREMAQVARMMPAGQDPTAEIKRAVARQALDRVVGQTAIAGEVARLRLAVPEDDLRQTILGMPAFRGPTGKFDRTTYEAALRNNGLNEPRFLALLREDLGQKQLLEAVRAGASSPEMETAQAFAEQSEQRAADYADFPLAPSAAPAPTAAELQRWYDNHPDLYSSPEYRKIKAVLLSPQLLAKDIPVTDDELKAEYDRTKDTLIKPGKRSVQVILVQDEARAKALAADWRAGADWAAMQEKAKQEGGSGVELTDATETEFPSPELGQAVFAATPGTVADPGKSALGWFVLKVTSAEAGTSADFASVKPELQSRVVAEKSADVIYDRANKIDNALASGSSLDELPGDLGAAAIAGSLDADGKTMEGQPAPIPGEQPLRTALVAAAFQAHKGDPPHLTEVPLPGGGSAYYALGVEDIVPPAVKPFDAVKAAVAADLARDGVRKRTEQAAAKFLAALKGGQSFANAAAASGVTPHRTPLFSRNAPGELPPELVQAVFELKKNEPGMVETPAGFTVFTPAQIVSPDPKADPVAYDKVQTGLTRSYGDDLELTFASALRQRAGVQVNETLLNNFIQP